MANTSGFYKQAKLSKKKVTEAIPGTGGILLKIAKKCFVDRGTLWRFLKKYPEMNKLIEQEKEKLIDIAEDSLIKNITEGEFQATKFFLQSKGRTRGYGEHKTIEHKGENRYRQLNIQIMNVLVDYPDALKGVMKNLENSNSKEVIEEDKDI